MCKLVSEITPSAVLRKQKKSPLLPGLLNECLDRFLFVEQTVDRHYTIPLQKGLNSASRQSNADKPYALSYRATVDLRFSIASTAWMPPRAPCAMQFMAAAAQEKSNCRSSGHSCISP